MTAAREGIRRRRRLFAPLGLALLLAAPAPAHALRVVTWNLLNYDSTPGGNTITARQPYCRTVMANIGADLVILQELKTLAAKDSFVTNVLNVVEPGQWDGAVVDVSSGEFMAVCWKPAKMAVSNVLGISTSGPRKILQSLVKPAGYLTKNGWFRLYSFHLKAGGPATADSTTRRLECTDIRNTLNNVPQTVVGPNFLIGGDSNFYGSYEGGYIRLTESQTNDNGRCVDPLPLGGLLTWHNQSGFAIYDTQSACSSCPIYSPSPGFSGGGMDDRFDLIFGSTTMRDGEGLDMTQSFAYGQDGLHFNGNINSPANTAVPQVVADALWATSDHLPAIGDLQLASRVRATSALAFGTVIVGAPAVQETLVVADSVGVPGDDLDYSFATVPAGFTAPGGPFSAAAGAVNTHFITMSTASAASYAPATLGLATDDPDSTTKNVLLTGAVLRHADASLDSVAAITADTLELGSLASMPTLLGEVRVHDRGYDALQARLAVNAGTLAGSPRFSLVGGFSPTLIAAIGHSYVVAFDSTGASPDTTYEATLTFGCADEPLPGAAAQPDLVVTLRARNASTTAVPGDEIPLAFALHAPRPNPLHAGGCAIGFELPRRAAVELAIYDLSGRRITTLVTGERPAGRHTERWNGTDATGARVRAGLYFARFGTAGFTRTARIVVLP